MRKSSLKDYTSWELLSGDAVPEVSDEVTTGYALGSGSNSSGLHPARKDKLCTWLNCERDVVMTGDGRTAPWQFSVFHYISLAAIGVILCMTWPVQFSLFFSLSRLIFCRGDLCVVSLDGYGFVRQVYGQVLPIKVVLKLEPNGFSKRFDVVWQLRPAQIVDN